MLLYREHAHCALFQWIKAVVNHVRDRFVIDYTIPLQPIFRDNDYWITRNTVDELMRKVLGLGSWVSFNLGLGSWVSSNLGLGSWVLGLGQPESWVWGLLQPGSWVLGLE